MTPTTGKNPMGLRPIYRVGLGFVVVGAAVLIGLELARPRPVTLTIRPGPRPKPIPPVLPVSEGPPTKIDADELALAGRERHDNVLEMVFCWCPPGQFSMGGGLRDRLGRYFLNGDPAWVTLRRGYWIGKLEVTQGQWQQLMGKSLLEQMAMDPRQPRAPDDGSQRSPVGIGPNHPISYISFPEAEEFCSRLTEAERKAGRLEAGWIYRLPTEVEWEYACRAGTTTATAFGNQLDSSQANFDGEVPFNKTTKGTFLGRIMPVGSYPPNAWGLHDMHGNVLEWCRDKPRAPTRGRPPVYLKGYVPLDLKPIRGGDYNLEGWRCLSMSLSDFVATRRGGGVGFRVALVSTELWREAEAIAATARGSRRAGGVSPLFLASSLSGR